MVTAHPAPGLCGLAASTCASCFFVVDVVELQPRLQLLRKTHLRKAPALVGRVPSSTVSLPLLLNWIHDDLEHGLALPQARVLSLTGSWPGLVTSPEGTQWCVCVCVRSELCASALVHWKMVQTDLAALKRGREVCT